MKSRKKYRKITRNRRSKIWRTRNIRNRTKNKKILVGGVIEESTYLNAYTKAVNRFAMITKSPAERIHSFIIPIARKYIDFNKLNSVFNKHIQFHSSKKLTKEEEIDEIIKPAVSEIAKPILGGMILSNILYSAGIELNADNLIDNAMKKDILHAYKDNNSLTKALLYDTETVLLPKDKWKEETKSPKDKSPKDKSPKDKSAKSAKSLKSAKSAKKLPTSDEEYFSKIYYDID